MSMNKSYLNNYKFPRGFHRTHRRLDSRVFVAAARRENLRPVRYRMGILSHVHGRQLSWSDVQFILDAPGCPFTGVLVRKRTLRDADTVAIAVKPIEDWLWVDTQVYFEYMEEETSPTERRLETNVEAEKALQMRKSAEMAKLTESQITRIRNGLSEDKRLTYIEIKSELLQLASVGKLSDLTPLEIERLTMMRMAELEGLIRLVNQPERFLSDREANAYMNLVRQIGESAQKQMDTHKGTKSQKKTAFDALQELANKGFDVSVTKKPSNIVDSEIVEYDDLLED